MNTTTLPPPDTLAEDLLEGADAIAAFLGWTPRRVYHVAEKGGLPIHKLPGIGLIARKSTLRVVFERLDAPYLTTIDSNLQGAPLDGQKPRA